jgi:hypothetical protein
VRKGCRYDEQPCCVGEIVVSPEGQQAKNELKWRAHTTHSQKNMYDEIVYSDSMFDQGVLGWTCGKMRVTYYAHALGIKIQKYFVRSGQCHMFVYGSSRNGLINDAGVTDLGLHDSHGHEEQPHHGFRKCENNPRPNAAESMRCTKTHAGDRVSGSGVLDQETCHHTNSHHHPTPSTALRTNVVHCGCGGRGRSLPLNRPLWYIAPVALTA